MPASEDARLSPPWARFSDEELLDLRICDLSEHLRIPESPLQSRISLLYRELADRNLSFRPYFWLSDEWYTPDGYPGTAIPFYLAHPRLAELERAQMLEVEGETAAWCMRILRHEAGHAIENAFNLRRRRRRIELFGRSSEPYPEHYDPRPYSRSFVLHLDSWYAQSHPDEDFAETFAVWLTPNYNWRRRYAGWKALKKLEYMDELMSQLAGQKPVVTTRRRLDPLHKITKTLREHYDAKREHYGVDYPDFFDRDLRRLFTDTPPEPRGITAHRFLRKHRRELRRRVARWTGAYQYTIDQVLQDMISRCRDLNLYLRDVPEQTLPDFLVVLAVHTMNYLHSGRHRMAV